VKPGGKKERIRVKLVTFAGPPSSGKTSAAIRTAEWGLAGGLDFLFTESAGLCNRCSPHIHGVFSLCVIDCLSGTNTPKKIGPMLRCADLVVVTKGDIVSASALGNRKGPCVYLMSWFFAHAVPKREYLEIVWPADGAIMSPLYVLLKKEDDEQAAARQKAVLDFLCGRKLGEAMAESWFAPVSREVSLPLPAGSKFRWVGWDYIHEMDFAERVEKIEAIYYRERGKIRPEEQYA
jgi:hypothetical protein